jgi:tRNA pseudouridine55 synthase
MATGVMIILVNQATKLSDLLLNETKKYLVTMKLYQATSTGDVEGEVISSTPNLELSEAEIKKVLAKYQNYTYQQIPPIYSAIKKDGRKLYEYARAGQEVTINPRTVTIIETKFLDYQVEKQEVSFETLVSKGTYIRSLVVDLAQDLKTVAHLTSLKRLASGNFSIDQASQLTSLSEADLIPIKTVIDQLDIQQYQLNDQELIKVNYGQKLTLELEVEQVFLVYQDQVIALYQKAGHHLYQSVKNNLN